MKKFKFQPGKFMRTKVKMKILKVKNLSSYLFYRIDAFQDGDAHITFYRQDYEHLNEIEFDLQAFNEFLEFLPTIKKEVAEAIAIASKENDTEE